jgi:hypothetical protein
MIDIASLSTSARKERAAKGRRAFISLLSLLLEDVVYLLPDSGPGSPVRALKDFCHEAEVFAGNAEVVAGTLKWPPAGPDLKTRILDEDDLWLRFHEACSILAATGVGTIELLALARGVPISAHIAKRLRATARGGDQRMSRGAT